MKPVLKNDIQQLESRKSHVNRNFEIVQEQVLDKKTKSWFNKGWHVLVYHKHTIEAYKHNKSAHINTKREYPL